MWVASHSTTQLIHEFFFFLKKWIKFSLIFESTHGLLNHTTKRWCHYIFTKNLKALIGYCLSLSHRHHIFTQNQTLRISYRSPIIPLLLANSLGVVLLRRDLLFFVGFFLFLPRPTTKNTYIYFIFIITHSFVAQL